MSRGFIYSDWNRGTDATAEPAYFYKTTKLAGEDSQDVQEQINSINSELASLKNILNQVKTTVDNIEPYTLPVATSTTLGGIKIGQGLDISNGILSTDGTTTPFNGSDQGLESTNLSDAIKETAEKASKQVIEETLILY